MSRESRALACDVIADGRGTARVASAPPGRTARARGRRPRASRGTGVGAAAFILRVYGSSPPKKRYNCFVSILNQPRQADATCSMHTIIEKTTTHCTSSRAERSLRRSNRSSGEAAFFHRFVGPCQSTLATPPRANGNCRSRLCSLVLLLLGGGVFDGLRRLVERGHQEADDDNLNCAEGADACARHREHVCVRVRAVRPFARAAGCSAHRTTAPCRPAT